MVQPGPLASSITSSVLSTFSMCFFFIQQERGIFHEDFDFDEESRFSSVFRGVDDGRYEENEDMRLDEHNNETFGVSSGSVINQSFPDRGKSNDGAQVSSSCSSAVITWAFIFLFLFL